MTATTPPIPALVTASDHVPLTVFPTPRTSSAVSAAPTFGNGAATSAVVVEASVKSEVAELVDSEGASEPPSEPVVWPRRGPKSSMPEGVATLPPGLVVMLAMGSRPASELASS